MQNAIIKSENVIMTLFRKPLHTDELDRNFFPFRDAYLCGEYHCGTVFEVTDNRNHCPKCGCRQTMSLWGIVQQGARIAVKPRSEKVVKMKRRKEVITEAR